MVKINNTPTAHLIVGFIGAGKTTFAKNLEKETGALRFTKDEWIIRIFGNDPKMINFEKYDNAITNLATDLALYCLQNGNDVIIDDGFWIRKQRDDIRNRISKMGAKVIFYYLKCSFLQAKSRVLNRNNNLTPDAFDIDKEMFDSYTKYFEEMEDDEEYTLVRSF